MTEQTVVVSTAPETEEPEASAETATAAEAVVLAAETAVALAAGGAALAIQEEHAAVLEVAGDVAAVEADVEAVEEHIEEQDRSLEALWREQQTDRTLLHQMQGTLENLTAQLTPQPQPEPETEILEAEPETISSSTLSDTSDPIAETLTEVTAGNVDESPVVVLEVENQKRRRRLI